MVCRLPTDRYPAHTKGGCGGTTTLAVVSAQRKPAPSSPDPAAGPQEPRGPRPGRLTAAAAIAGLEGLALLAGGIAMIVMGAAEGDLRSAVTGGVTLLALALLPLIAARGLLARRSWSCGPAVITQLLALPVAYSLLQADSVAIWAGILLGVAAVVGLVLLVHPATTQALGVRGPGRR
ncbi:uncharacterized membrane protein (DUF2068 family) [Streptomyces sp. MJP52]|nr:uncharacterized membrane protein (DUF2068 family) [Streptomyces sp. MJP52]